MRPNKQSLLIAAVICLTLVAAALRLYRLPDTLQFLGDQGRDALRVARIFKQGDLVFIGPVTSIGNMYLGPLYYYFMVPWLWLSYPSPLGPAYAVALLAILTVPLTYILGKQVVGKQAALIATFLMTLSTVIISYSRFSWNPNPAPLFGLLLIWTLYKAWKTERRHWWLLTAVCFSVLIQLHYLTLLSFFPIAIVAVYQLWVNRRKPKKLRPLLITGALWLALVVAFLVPLVVFDIKHGGTNLNALRGLMGGSTSITTFESTDPFSKLLTVVEETHGRSMQLLFDMYIGQVRWRNTILVVAVIALIGLLIRQKKGILRGQLLVLLFVVTAIAGTSFYSHSLYEHYVLYVIPAVFLLYGIIGSWLWRQSVIGRVVVLVCLAYYGWFNVQQLKFKTASPSLPLLQASAETIAAELQPHERYNVVLLSETKDYYGQNYRYFLDTIAGKEPVNPDHDDLQAVDTLVIINEEGVPAEEIQTLPIFEISSFTDVSKQETLELPTGSEAYIWRR